MNIPLIDYFRQKNVRTGLNQTSNSFKMAGYLVGPLIGSWIMVQLFAPKVWIETLQGASFGVWFVYIIVFYSFKKASASEFIVFPQSHWYFPDGQQISYDVLIPAKGWELIMSYRDGSQLYRVNFKGQLAYQDPDREFMDSFDFALWKTPALWNDSFSRNALGEFFFEGLFVTVSTGENISVSVVEWDERGSGRIPVCVISGCSYYYKKVMQTQGKEMLKTKKFPALEKATAIIKDLKITAEKLTTRNTYLEQEAEQFYNEEPVIIKDLANKRLESFAKRHNSIMNIANKSRWDRLLINGKYLAYFGVIFVISVLASHFILGWP